MEAIMGNLSFLGLGLLALIILCGIFVYGFYGVLIIEYICNERKIKKHKKNLEEKFEKLNQDLKNKNKNNDK